MAEEYVNKESLAKYIDSRFGEISTPFVVREIRGFPSADVVPKSEVETAKAEAERLKYDNQYLMSELSKAREQIAFMKRAEELDKIPKWQGGQTMTNKKRIEDLLIEFDELDMQPMLIVPDPTERAKAWKHELMYAIKRLEVEVAREIFEDLDNFISQLKYDVFSFAYTALAHKLAELKKKYMGEKE